MAYKKSNPNGQATMANSEPVVLASDQSAVPVSSSTFATTAKQDTQITHLATLAGAVAGTEVQVDVLTMPTVAVTGTFWQATQPVSIASAVPVTDNSGSLTVDAPVGTPVFVRLSDGAAAITTLPVSVASLPSHAVTNVGVFAVQVDGAALTSLQLIDDVIKTLGTDTYTEASTKGAVIGAVRRDANTSLVDTTNEIAPLQVNATGELKVAQIQALPAGTNNIGDVDIASIAAGDNNIGNVDIVTMPTVTVNTHAVTATDLDIRNLTNVDVVTAELSAVDNAVLDTIDAVLDTIKTDTALIVTAVQTLDNAIAGSEMQVDIVGSLPAGSALIGKVGIDQTTPGTTNAVQDIPATSGGLSKFHLVGAATDNATNIKASAGQVYSITAFNLNASPRYLKFHNTAGTPTAGSGVTDTFLIPGNTAGAGLVLNIDKGIAFGTGIGITIVTGIADSNTTAISASEVVINVYYK